MHPIYLLSPTFQHARTALCLGQLSETLDAIDSALAYGETPFVAALEAEHLRFLVYFYSGQHQAADTALAAMRERWSESDDLLVRFHLNLALACWDLIVDFPSALRRIADLVEWQSRIPACDHPAWRGRLDAWHGVALAFNGRFADGYALAARGCRTLEDLAATGVAGDEGTRPFGRFVGGAYLRAHLRDDLR